MTTSGRSRIVDRIMKQESVRADQPAAPLAEEQTAEEPAHEQPGGNPPDTPETAEPQAEAPTPLATEAEAPLSEPMQQPDPAAADLGPTGGADPVEEPPPAPEPQAQPATLEASAPAEGRAEEANDDDDEEEEDLGQLMDAMQVRKGEILTGTIAQIDEDGVRVDIGTKSEGLIPQSELEPDYATEFNLGDEVEVYVMKVETEEGYPLLSKSRADFHKLWNELEEHVESGKVLTVLVKDRVKGGLIVDVGVDGFVPASHTTSDSRRRPGNLDKFVGRTLRVRVIECDRKRNRVVLSHRQVVEEERRRREQETLEKLETGAAMSGVVRRITDFGAFVDLGGIDGLLHISEMSWTRINHPSDVLSKGDKVQVIVLKWDPQTKRISLGMRQLLADPWKGAAKRYAVGSTVRTQITRIIRNGAFAKLDSGIEGIIPISEMSQKRINAPEDVVSVGDEVEARVLQVRERQRRITLSLREAEQARERKEFREYMRGQNSGGSVTLGDVFGDMFKDSTPASGESPQAARPEQPQPEAQPQPDPPTTPETEPEQEAPAEATSKPEPAVVPEPESVEETAPAEAEAQPSPESASTPEGVPAPAGADERAEEPQTEPASAEPETPPEEQSDSAETAPEPGAEDPAPTAPDSEPTEQQT